MHDKAIKESEIIDEIKAETDDCVESIVGWEKAIQGVIDTQ